MKKVTKIKISLIISLFAILLFNVKAFAATGIVTEITVNVREKASTNSKRIMYVTQDDKVEILEKSGEWYKIKYKNKTGYVYAKYVKVKDDETISTSEEDNNKAEEENKEEKDTTKDVEKNLKIFNDTEVRMIPNISSEIIYIVKSNTDINIIEQIGNWTYISFNNIQGWVRTDKITEETTTENKM